jgi:hemoglobin
LQGVAQDLRRLQFGPARSSTRRPRARRSDQPWSNAYEHHSIPLLDQRGVRARPRPSPAATRPSASSPTFTPPAAAEADQRAEQQVAKVQQLRGEGVGDDKKKRASPASRQPEPKKSLFERLGGEPGVSTIVEDWVNRLVADPRVNFTRKGVTRAASASHRNDSVEWQNVPENGTKLKKHFAQFLTSPPAARAVRGQGDEGGPRRHAHRQRRVRRRRGDLKSSLDNLGVPTTEQKELLAIVESTRPQVATQR